ncbi:hypothetical protein ACIGW7_34660 [Streptomyces sp. NPDC053253]|uniref:hypothetical protein n=1 Tax=Streptomyces sp. NPDC053253 TaxID=3365699 RepID=UPI0037D02230
MIAADQPRPLRAVGAEKVVAEGALSGSDRQSSAGPRVIGFLRIALPAWEGGTPAAEWFCSCGRYETARGETQVRKLIAAHDDHRAVCPFQAEGRAAA